MINLSRYWKIIRRIWSLVGGDVTSTKACSIVAQKHHTKLAHVEAGIRSAIDKPDMKSQISYRCDHQLFFYDSDCESNYARVGTGEPDFFCGNTMIDTCLDSPRIRKPPLWMSFPNRQAIHRDDFTPSGKC